MKTATAIMQLWTLAAHHFVAIVDSIRPLGLPSRQQLSSVLAAYVCVVWGSAAGSRLVALFYVHQNKLDKLLQ